jgi:hypothetical protein
MTDIGDSQFHQGQPVWVVAEGGELVPAEYVGEGETSAWFGGPPTVLVVLTETRAPASVEADRVIAREASE